MRHPRRPRRARLAAARLRARAGSARAVCMTALALLACRLMEPGMRPHAWSSLVGAPWPCMLHSDSEHLRRLRTQACTPRLLVSVLSQAAAAAHKAPRPLTGACTPPGARAQCSASSVSAAATKGTRPGHASATALHPAGLSPATSSLIAACVPACACARVTPRRCAQRCRCFKRPQSGGLRAHHSVSEDHRHQVGADNYLEA